GYHLVSGAYFETLGVPVVRGRVFDERDRAGSPRVAIINATAAHRFFPGADPIGKRIWLGAGYGPEEDMAEVVGVVADVKYGAVEQPSQPHAYLAYAQYMEDAGYLLIRTATPPAARLLPSVRAEVSALDPNLPLFDVKTMSRRLAEATSRTRFGATLLGIFAALALALAAVGVYGVVSFSVAARTREIGIRRALGADDRTVVWQVMREGGAVALVGVAIGVLIALTSVRLLESQLYEVRSSDLSTITTVATVLLASSLLASYIPSRRATRLDSLRALMSE
ncbi:MAG: FtsX-like permease family protein, partial [Longimicrobiales bacterium]